MMNPHTHANKNERLLYSGRFTVVEVASERSRKKRQGSSLRRHEERKKQQNARFQTGWSSILESRGRIDTVNERKCVSERGRKECVGVGGQDPERMDGRNQARKTLEIGPQPHDYQNSRVSSNEKKEGAKKTGKQKTDRRQQKKGRRFPPERG